MHRFSTHDIVHIVRGRFSPVREAEQLSSLIGDIYDAALDSSLWTGVLAGCARFVRGPAAALFCRDTARKSCSAAYYTGLDARYKRLIVDKCIKADPLMMGQVFAKIRVPVAISDTCSNEGI